MQNPRNESILEAWHWGHWKGDSRNHLMRFTFQYAVREIITITWFAELLLEVNSKILNKWENCNKLKMHIRTRIINIAKIVIQTLKWKPRVILSHDNHSWHQQPRTCSFLTKLHRKPEHSCHQHVMQPHHQLFFQPEKELNTSAPLQTHWRMHALQKRFFPHWQQGTKASTTFLWRV